MKRLKLILGDQLNAKHSWYKARDNSTYFVMLELHQEADYVRHHIQKLLGFFAAMRAFANALETAGHQVIYLTLDDAAPEHSLTEQLERLINDYDIGEFHYQAPDEYRLDKQLREWCGNLNIPTTMVDTEHFLTPREAWQTYPMSRMEFFYRALRKHYKVLLDEQGKPFGERWNFDTENRKKLPESKIIPEPLCFSKDVSDILAMIKRHQIVTIGYVDATHFIWPTTRQEARELLNFFLCHCLPEFGHYQDAMTSRGWSLYHSRLSFALNTKMLHPLDVIRRVENHWKEHSQQISLAQVEGFIRQILGWREFVRALYWQHMPDYAQLNSLNADRHLPDFFWTGNTKMACVSHAINQSLEQAYAHHIQRLMITGNFGLLAGIHPDQMDQWYLGIYIDAIEWVEMPNTRGMSQYADGGIIASKPYAASGNYIQKMGHYCKSCHYDVKSKFGEMSCPFNSLYWHFLKRHEDSFRKNPRMSLAYKAWEKQSKEQQTAILKTADDYLHHLNDL